MAPTKHLVAVCLALVATAAGQPGSEPIKTEVEWEFDRDVWEEKLKSEKFNRVKNIYDSANKIQ